MFELKVSLASVNKLDMRMYMLSLAIPFMLRKMHVCT